MSVKISNTRRSSRLLTLVALSAVLAASCGGGGAPLTISAPLTIVGAGQTLQFSATGGGKSAIIWSVNSIDGGNATVGTISTSGLYSAPLAPPSPNTVTVTATRSKKTTETASQTISVNYALPALTALTPPTATVDGGGISVTLNGTGFTPATTALADATNLTLTFVSTTQLTAQIPGSIAGVISTTAITVNNPAPGGGTSSSITLPIFGLGIVTPTGNPQVVRYSIETPVDADVNIEFGLTTSYGTPTWTVPTPGGGGTVEIIVAGMRDFSEYHMRAVANIPGGPTHFDADHTFTTGGLDPIGLRPMTVTKHATLSPTPGVVWMSMSGGGRSRSMVVDNDGEIIWFYDGPPAVSHIRFLPDGTVASFELDGSLMATTARIVNLAGETVKLIEVDALNQRFTDLGIPAVIRQFHHEVLLLPNGNHLLITDFEQDFTDVVGFEGQTITVVGDGIVEVDANLDPVWTWSGFDHFDINRHPWDFPSLFTGNFELTHSNSLDYIPADGNLLVSVRNQSWVVKIDYQDGMGDGSILWRLGNEGDLPLASGDIEKHAYMAHTATVLDDALGTFRVAVYDNGVDRPVVSSGLTCRTDLAVDCFSRAAIFEIDEAVGTSTLLWENNLLFFSPFLGSTQFIAPDRVFHDSGFIGGANGDSRIREVTMDGATPEIVWELFIEGQNVYRATKLPSLYPGVQW